MHKTESQNFKRNHCMSLVSHDYPTFEDFPDTEKPVALANKPFPYNQIADPRRYEQLVYSLYSAQIRNHNFEEFDNISLMSGVREKGRDCALFSSGKSTGLIQCKKHASNLSIPVFGEEITKFALYSLLESNLIDNPDNFTYYIAVSTGFVSDCSDFIDNFNERILKDEESLQMWITKNLKMPTLFDLKLQQNSLLSQIQNIFKKITVKKIGPIDLDAVLTLPSCSYLIKSFFDVRTVVSEEAVLNLDNKITQYVFNVLDETKIKAELKKSSAGLYVEKNHLEEVPDSHIERQETAKLLQWIIGDTTKDDKGRDQNICLLAGNAGMGKTVILKDLYDELIKQEIPVLGLKADKLVSTSIIELQHKIGLSIPILDFINQCKQNYSKTIILIDQIDALSQAMSADRNYLMVFKSIIDQYTYDPNIRIIISVRIFDLQYDPSLRIYKNLKTINAEPFTDEQVLKLLEKAGISGTEISTKLLQLLKTPNHLNIFTRLTSAIKGGSTIRTLQDLYNELYKLKILSVNLATPVHSDRLKKVLFRISGKMFDSQSITVSELHFEEFKNELSYLESERLIKIEEGQIQFFHQTFYDFIFAKRFVEKSLSLSKYIIKQDQSIFIRSAVKMIFNHLRLYDPNIYITQLTKIFKDDRILFHIKQLCFSLLLFHDNPSDEEKLLVTQILQQNSDFELLFLEYSRSERWLIVALEKKIIENFLRDLHLPMDDETNELRRKFFLNSIVSFLQFYIAQDHSQAWDYVLKINNVYIKETILSRIENWSSPKAYQLLEQCSDFYVNDTFGYFLAMNNIAEVNPEYCLNTFESTFLTEGWLENTRNTDYQEKKVFKTLSQNAPGRLIDFLLPIFLKELEQNNDSYSEVYNDHFYADVKLIDRYEEHGKGYYYWLLASCLRTVAQSQKSEFYDFLQDNRSSNYEAVLRLVIYAVSTSESIYIDEIYNLFKYFYDKKRFITSSDLGVEFRDLLEKSFMFFSPLQLKEIINMLLQLKIPGEATVWAGSCTHLNVGHTQHVLLHRFPREIIDQNKELKKLELELNRKFKPYKETYSTHNILAGAVHRPLEEHAYEKMSIKQWLKSFRKYNHNREPFQDDFLKGGLREHSFAFKEFSKRFPGKDKENIINRVIQDGEISFEYALLGLEGLCEAEYPALEIHKSFKQIMPLQDNFIDRSYFVSIASYLLQSGIDDSEVLDILLVSAKTGSRKKNFDYTKFTETSIRGLLTAGINTEFGRATKALMLLQNDNYEEITFSTVQHLLHSGPDELKGLILHYFAYLNKVNRGRSFKIFTDYLAKEDNIYIMASAIWSMQYMGNHDFKKLRPVYQKLIINKSLGKDDSRLLFSILYFSYLLDKEGAEELLLDLINTNHFVRSSAFNVIFEHFYFSENSPLKANKVLMHILISDKVDPSQNLRIYYLEFDSLKLEDISDFLVEFIKSPQFQFSAALVKYLTVQCSKYAILAIKIFNLALEYDKDINHQDKGYQRDNETTRFIVGAFNSLKGSDSKSKKQKKKLLLSYDKLLKNYSSRRISEKILEELI
jgi:hypothetical protein